MKMRMAIAMALLLAGCASTTNKDGLVRRDGSWYAPARDGHGDYYTGSDRRYLGATPWAWSIGFAPYDGYCSVIYRYCVSDWNSPWYGWGYGGSSPWAWAWVPPPRHRRTLREQNSFRSVFEEHQGPPPVGEPAPSARSGSGIPAGSRRPDGGWGGSHREGRAPRLRRDGASGGGPD